LRLIYVTSGFPYPLTSGYLRHYHFLERLAHDHEIRLFSLVGHHHTPEDRAAVERLGVEVTTFDVHSTPWVRYISKMARLVPRLAAGGVSDLRRAVGECAASGWADAAIVSGKSTSSVLSSVTGLPLLVDACDATSMRLESRLPNRHGLDRILAKLELRATRSVEQHLNRRADHMIVASARDAEHLGWSETMSVVPNGVDTGYWSRTSSTRPRDTVIFTGKMSYAPNDDAAMRLIDEVWPLVLQRRPAARLMIVGTSPLQRLIEAGARPDITVTGRVDDMRTYLGDATVFAAPIRFGAGIQNKLLEALSMEVPVVASSNAADGLIIDGEHPPVRTTDDLHTMADLIVDELEAADREPAPIEANRLWVANRFDWDVSARRIDAILEGLISHRGRERKP
jgi:glycosyltransferase involved in cell wall biosynthesis